MKESFTPTYYDSENIYKQDYTKKENDEVNRFSPSQGYNYNRSTGSSSIALDNGGMQFLTGYNNPYTTASTEYYPLTDNKVVNQSNYIQQNSLYAAKTINGIPLKDYYDNYTTDVLTNGKWFLNKDMPQDTNQYLENSDVQQRMEMFTGLRQSRDREDLGIPTRKETLNLFTPAERTTGYGYQYGMGGGGPGLSITRQKEFEELQQTIKFKTNEQPFEKIQVGKGLAIDPSIPAAGGFQQYTRVVPDNISDYKANQLPGMVAGGKWLMSNAPTSQQPVVKNRPEGYYSLCQYGPMPGRSTVTAPMVIGDYSVKLKNQNRSFINYGYGVPLNTSLDTFLTS